jgi:tyrosinase
MSRLSRRSFMTGMAVMPFGLWLQSNGYTAGPTRTRYEARSTEGKKMLKIYADAVTKMINSIPKGDPLNWEFQWYSHSVPPDGTPANKTSAIQSVYGPRPSPHKALATSVWNNCQAHQDTDIEDYFLPWHRMFVMYFESIIRSVSKNDSFTLPYWNYSAGQESAKIPEEFRSGILSRPNRNPGVNNGNPIASDILLDAKPALRQRTYRSQGVAVDGFNLALDKVPHGRVHVRVGDTTNMGNVPTAGRDPVFWMHHSNIDRLWASWNRNGGQNPTDQWRNKQFTFADANGKPVMLTNGAVDDIAKLNYTYDRFEPPPPNFRPMPMGVLFTPKAQIFAQAVSRAVNLSAGPVRVSLEPQTAPKGKQAMTDRLASLAPEREMYLVVKDLHTNLQPGVLYNIYLDLPEGASANEESPNYAGTIDFFDAHARHGASASSNQKFFSFDITDVAKKLQSKNALDAKPTVTIAPVGEPTTNSSPVVGHISLVEQ